MRYGAISLTASAQVLARPSRIGSPNPVMPALVWIFKNNQRGLTRKVSSLVIFRGSLAAMGASLRRSLAHSAPDSTDKPSPANPPARRARRSGIRRQWGVVMVHISCVNDGWPMLRRHFPQDKGANQQVHPLNLATISP